MSGKKKVNWKLKAQCPPKFDGDSEFKGIFWLSLLDQKIWDN